MTSSFQYNILSIAQGLLPHLKTEELELFWESFAAFFEGLDNDSSGKLKMLLKLISVLSLFYFQKKITKLSPQQLDRFMHKLSNFPIAKITAGFTGLRSLIMVSYYSCEISWKEIGYKKG